jgi:DNA-damage-inducible protein J
MSKSVMIHARIEPALKNETEQTLKSLGLNMTQAITLFLQQIKIQKGLPFEVKLPSTQTQKALTELEQRKGKTFSNIDDLFNELEE